MVSATSKRKFHDDFLDVDLDLTSQEIIDYGIYVLEDKLEPEAFSEELEAYEETLKLLKDSNINLKERVNQAIEVMEIINIYEVK
ncbi:MAG: hypothetical protein MSN52_05595 [Limosilactobacillus reuteri]|nr:hypothetical protein [Limosilactobacillus reuteri]